MELLTEVEEPRVILPEGHAEWALAKALIRHHGVNNTQSLKFKNHGNTTFRGQLEAIQPQIIAGEIQTVFIIADNDDDPLRAFSTIQAGIDNAEGLDLVVPESAWTVGGSGPAVGVAMLPADGRNGTVETLIWNALHWRYPDPADAAEGFISGMPTGQEDLKLTTREKARFSAAIAATCEYDPSCMVHWMWQSNRGYRELLDHDCFSDLVAFISRD